ncbi:MULTISPECIES: NADPH-dependent F420 reductase [Ralstonia solanacearum species complex]|uniref:Dinucleotide-binding enzyme oxidoreductase protein n=4 Tax=Ralstonia solanacearum species complex TaxID=3116862 RepID=Q8XQS2_RALN1|nr:MULTISPECIES: NADPH-dependent F420 reductase [Ralstonia solanacearum species complex]AKZ29064.1 NADPH-dependent F420 reductase [Ralstonia solanacearum]APC66732.1 NADPH-dependent F420 reductase [Ralstonia solanacearum OE1-1]API77653.1 NADPH-dependent F420 reductase [Ralstonia pseudosolanacearum]ASL76325.1 NADPH-dependent F420 reductase [Ralstonia pseudosolanacearum]AST30117.1 NADPH-dependent F420 reductase [Ralstonia pseudosolanacearum]
MKIAVIGTGNIGAAYARALADAKFEVVIGHREPSKAAALAQEISPNVEGGGISAAFKLADMVLLALPYPAIAEVLADAGDLTGKVLIDVSNPLSADFQNLVVGLTTSAAEQIQTAAPSAHVVKAFNTIFAGLVPAQAREGKQLQVFVAGDDAAATAQVRELARALGFVPVNAGPLRNSRFLEPVGMMNIQFGFFLGAGPATAPAWIHA